MFSVAQVARHLNVSGTTIRNYAAEFGAYLSPSASPAAGVQRAFTEDDIEVLETIAVMRGQGTMPPDIAAALDEGQRMARQGPPGGLIPAAEDIAPAAAFTTALTVLESRLDKLEDRLERERTARIDAEKRATAAETELRVLREIHAADQSTAPRPLSFTEWLRSRRG